MLWPQRIVRFFFTFTLCVSFFFAWKAFEGRRLARQMASLELVRHFPFSSAIELAEWKQKVLKGRVDYGIETFNGESCVLARSENTASALYLKTKIDIGKFPILSWRWNVFEFPKKKSAESLLDAKEDDFGARVYVIFPSFFVGGMKALEYIWTESVPKGQVSASPYTSNIKLIVLESGHNTRNDLLCESRNLYEDYVMAFGQEPKGVVCALAIMTDSDSTGTSARAVYDDIKIQYKRRD